MFRFPALAFSSLTTRVRTSAQRGRRIAPVMGWMAAAWLCQVADCWAQVRPGEEEPEPKGYVPSYMIIIFAVAGVLMMICRSGKRSVSFRRDD